VLASAPTFRQRGCRTMAINIRPIAIYGALILAFSALGAVRGSIYAVDMVLIDRFLVFGTCNGVVWPMAGLASVAALHLMATRNKVAAVLASIVGGVLAAVVGYFWVGLVCAAFQDHYPSFADILVPGSARLAANLGTYLLDPRSIYFVAMWVVINVVYWKIAPGALILGEAGSTADVETPARYPAEVAAPTTVTPAAPAGVPRFLRQVSPKLGRDLLAIAAEQHYVRVFTKLGSDLILYRFSDAVVELAGWPGIRIHRSYWVMRTAIDQVQPRGKSYSVTLTNGQVVPVSVSHRALVDPIAAELCGQPG
jgi:LytTr DNA-binding domain